MDDLMVDLFLEAPPPKESFLNLDSADDPLHGNQEGRFFHGYYGFAAVRRLRQPCAVLAVAATSTVRRVRWRNWRASSNGFAGVGQKAESSFAATAGRDEFMTWCDDNLSPSQI